MNKSNGSVTHRGRPLKPLSCEIVLHVLEMLTEERNRGALLKPLDAVISRVAAYTGLSEDVVQSIIEEDSTVIQKEKKDKIVVPETSKGNRKRRYEISVISDKDIIQTKQLICDYYIGCSKLPHWKELLEHILHELPVYENDIDFLRRTLCSLGYQRKKCLKQWLFVEDPAIVTLRNEYLQEIRKQRYKTNNIFYVFEGVVDEAFHLNKSYSTKYSNNDALYNNKNHLIFCVGSADGFLKPSTLVIKNDVENINNIFINWIKEHLIPNLPKHSIVVMDQAPHHCLTQDQIPSYYVSKAEMVDYLIHKNISCNIHMNRNELYRLIGKYKPKQRQYIIDEMLYDAGHRTLRLPSVMVDLSITQHIMEKLQSNLSKKVNLGFHLKEVTNHIENEMYSVTSDTWNELFVTVRNLEDFYWKKDVDLENAMETKVFSCVTSLDDDNDDYSSESDVNDEV